MSVDKLKTKVLLTVECEVEGDPEFFDTSEGTLKWVAHAVLMNAMREYSDSRDRDGMRFKCLTGVVTMQGPRFEGDGNESQ